MLIDSHCHLDFPEFQKDLPGALGRAKGAGVARFVTISTSLTRYDVYRGIAEHNDEVWFSTGVHPHQAHEEPEPTVDELMRLAAHPKCVAIGEAGLDYHYDRAPRELAARVFRTHIAAARESGLPLVIHAREADEDMAAILREESRRGAFSAVLHCFTSSRELAQTGLELGLYISFSGIITFKNSDALRLIAHEAPLDRVLVETDAPFLAPAPHRGKPNEPAFVADTARKLAQIKELEESEIAEATTRNALRLFSKMPKIGALAA